MMFSRNSLTRTAVVGLALAALALTGCTASNQGGDTAKSGNRILTLDNGGTGQFVQNYNPFSPTVLEYVNGFIYEPLFFFNALAPLETKPVPLLGKSFSWNADGTALTVTTQSGVKWSDNTPFTAKDVAFSFNLVRNTPAFNTSGNAPKASATDDTHVTLAFDKPAFVDGPTFLGSTYMVPKHIWEKKDKASYATDVNKNPVGTGPMSFSSFTPQSWVLKKNKDFRDASSLQVDSVRVLALSGNQAITNKLLAGDLDWSSIYIPDVDKVLKAAPTVQYSETATTNQIELTTCSSPDLGCTGPQTSPAVRQAIAAAMDRNQINKLAYFGKGTPISAAFALPDRDKKLIAPEYSHSEPMSKDVKKAQSLLEADGWTKGSDGIYAKDGERLSMPVLVTSGYTDYISVLDVMAQQLKAAGIEIKPQQVASNDNGSSQGLGKFQLAISALYQGPIGDPYYVYNTFYNGASTAKVGESVNPYGNVARFSNSEVDAALAKAAGTQDIDAKAAAYKTIQSIIVKDMPYIPVLNHAGGSEYNTARFTGFPTAANPYATASAFSAPANEQVLLHLKAK